MITNRRPLESRDYLDILRRRKWLIVCPTLLVAVATFFFTKSLPNLYRSDTLVLIEEQKVPEAYVRPTVQSNLDVRLQTMTHQILSRTRLQSIIEKFGLFQNSGIDNISELVARLRKDIEIELVSRRDRSGGVAGFKIYYVASSPQVAQDVLREVTSLFIEENLRMRQQQAVRTTQFLDGQLTQARQSLQDHEQRLREFKTRHFGELPQEQQANLTLLGQAHIQLQANSGTLDRYQREKTYLESSLAAETRKQGSGTADTPARRLEAVRALLLDLEAKYTSDHPDVISTKAEIARLEQAFAEVAQGEESDVDDAAVDSAPAVQSAEAIRIRSRLEVLELAREQTLQERKKIQQRIQTLQRRVTITPLREQQLTELSRDYAVAERQYDSLLQKKHESQIAADLEKRQQGERFYIIDPPNLPSIAYKPDRLRLNLLGVGGGLFLAFGLAAAVEFKDETLRNERDVNYYLGIPTLASVPRVRILDRKRRRAKGLFDGRLDSGAVSS